MGTSNLKYYNGRYQGTLSDENAKKIDFILNTFDKNHSIPALEEMVYDLTPVEVERVLNSRKPIPHPKVGKLRPYQTLGVTFMYYAERCLLGDSVGLGKTIQIGGLINLIKQTSPDHTPPRVLFFCEKKSASELQSKLIRFTNQPFLRVEGIKEDMHVITTQYNPSTCPSLVVTHSALNNLSFQDWIIKGILNDAFDLVVVDESSILGNSSTQVYKAVKKMFKGTRRLVLLNATPFEKNLDTFYNQLNLLDPNLLPTKTTFDKTYKIMSFNDFYPKFTGKYRRAEEFQRLVSLRYLPRTRSELGGTFENCTAEVLTHTLTPLQQRLLVDTSQYRLVYDCPWVLNPEAVSPKVEGCTNLVCDLAPEPVLVYCHFLAAQSALQEALTAQGVSCEVLNGSTSSSESRAIMERFRSGDTRVLITNLQKSMDFEFCDNVVFYSYNPNPSKMIQFEGRITRDFDIKDKHLWVLLSEGKEYDTFFTTLKQRAEASEAFAGVDHSMLMLLMKGD